MLYIFNIYHYEILSFFQPSHNRTWLIDVMEFEAWWIPVACFLPAIFLTVLIVMDQQITAVIVNRKDNKLKVNP